MTIRTIITYPDPRLSLACAPVTVFDAHLASLCDDLVDTMRAANGIGITAAHIGVSQRVSVIQLAGNEPLRIHINPVIIHVSPVLQRFTEGSVSMQGATDTVERPSSIRFRYQDISGEMHEEDADGFLCTCIQHEIDQLDGIFWLKRLSRLKRDRLLRKWEKQASS